MRSRIHKNSSKGTVPNRSTSLRDRSSSMKAARESGLSDLISRNQRETGLAQLVSPAPTRSGQADPRPDHFRPVTQQGSQTGFGNARIHTDVRAAETSRELGARAFTVGRDIYFGQDQYQPDTARGRRLLGHELVHVAQQTGQRGFTPVTSPVIARQGLLSPAEELAAIHYNRSRYDERSIRIIQTITGTGVDGDFGRATAEAVAVFQQANGLTIDGMVGTGTLDRMVPNRALADRHEHAIQLVVDFHNLDITSDTLSVHFDPSLGFGTLGTTDFETGNLRVIRLGPLAFISQAMLRTIIQRELNVPAPAHPAPGPRPSHLSRAEEISAIRFNRSRFSDPRSVRTIQEHVNSEIDGEWGPDSVQRIAEYQDNQGAGIDGMAGETTLELIVTDLIGNNQQNAAIRLIVDFYDFRDDGNLLDVRYDASVTSNAVTDFRPNEPVRVRIGPDGINQPFAGVVHTIAHEYEHVRRLKEGIGPAATHEFLGEAIEILSVGMQEEHLETVARGDPAWVPGFANDAQRALRNWNNMPLADQRRFRGRFLAVRQKVRATIAAGTPAQRALHAGLVAAYNAAFVPPA